VKQYLVKAKGNPYGLKRVLVFVARRGAASSSGRDLSVAWKDATHIHVYTHSYISKPDVFMVRG